MTAPATTPIETPVELNGYADVVRDVMREWQVPGAAVAIAKNGHIVFAEGFGVRDVDKELPVTTGTLFGIGSTTKAFTTMGLALLADEGRLDWDAPVTTYLPSFKLHDPVASERITPRDLVTHRSGLPRHDMLWYGSTLTRQEMVERLRDLEPNKDFRAAWQYQNLMYLAAGHLSGHIAGQSWEAFVQERIFDRLGMTGSNFSVATSQEAADFSRPYQEKDGTVRVIPFRNIDQIAPAGAINSNLDDMASWLLLHLNHGKHDGAQFVSEGQLAQMHAPTVAMPDPGKYSELALPSYGLGWGIESYRGHTVVDHGGAIDGFRALVSLMPREQIGIVVFTNLNRVPVPEVLAYHAYDRLLGLEPLPWHERWRKEHLDQQTAGERGKAKSETARVQDTRPSHPLTDYAGAFAHPGYGIVTIEHDGSRDASPLLRFNAFDGPLRHRHYDTFEFTFDLHDERIPVSFATDVQGAIASLAIPLEPMVGDIVFRRQPPPAMTETSFLEPFVGTYDLMGTPMTVALKGQHALRISLPGQADWELEGRRGTEFRAKGLSGFTVEFQRDASGAIAEATLTTPDGVYTAPRQS